MRYAKPILIGVLFGLMAGSALMAGLYVSPWRQAAYFEADPDIADLRAKLSAYREWLSQADARIAMGGPDADSLRARQASAWRDYKAWRSRLGGLARVHEQSGGEAFLRWAFSLRFWAGPGLLALILLGAAASAWKDRNRYRPPRARPAKAPRPPAEVLGTEAHARAVSDFEAAVKQVARIARTEPPVNPSPVPPRQPRPAPQPEPAVEPPPTDRLPILPFGASAPSAAWDLPDGANPANPAESPHGGTPPPGTVFRPSGEVIGSADQGDGRETRIFNVEEGWEMPPPDPPPGTASRAPAPGLPMEDEDASFQGQGNPPGTPGAMPPTTEVERVERRKDEVLKLARKGLTSSEISRRMRISQDQVEIIIRLRREKG